MGPPLKAFLANERTYLDWIGMSISLGSVAAALLALGETPTQTPAGANAARFLGLIMMPVALCFTLYSASLYKFRRDLLKNDDLFNHEMHSTRVPNLLGYILCFALSAILLLDLFGGLVHV